MTQREFHEKKLTAYALGELHGDELKKVESWLQDHPEAQAQVDEIKMLGEIMSRGFESDDAAQLTPQQKNKLKEKTTHRKRGKALFWTSAVAAGLTAFALVMPKFFSDPSIASMVEKQNRAHAATNEKYRRESTAQTSADEMKNDLGSAALDKIGSGDVIIIAENGEKTIVPLSSAIGEIEIVNFEDAPEELKQAHLAEMESVERNRPVGKKTKEKLNESVDQTLEFTGKRTPQDGSQSVAVTGGELDSNKPAGVISPDSGRGTTRKDAQKLAKPSTQEVTETEDWEIGIPAGPPKRAKADKSEMEVASMGKDAIDEDQVGFFREVSALQSEQSGVSNTESYDRIVDNPFFLVTRSPLSTFSIDVDTASYAMVRRFLQSGQYPPKDAVRIEELINSFDYAYPEPAGTTPFSVHTSVASAPWQPNHRLAMIGLKGRHIPLSERPACNLVFLVDVSGSMSDANKLPLVKRSLHMLVDRLDDRDAIAMVVYAGASGVVLDATNGSRKKDIKRAIEALESGGSTHGSSGIQLAYEIAGKMNQPGATSRVILATDGDFNVGISSQGELTRLIEEKAKSGIFLTVLGYGMGNYKDATLEKLADHGNGFYAYIDSEKQAKKTLVDQMVGTLITIAKDVKIQVEFNPIEVKSYRLIGYANRILAHQDFNDDKVDAGDIGAGHTVTALYEIIPHGVEHANKQTDPLKYQTQPELTSEAESGELFTVKLRYKQPNSDVSHLISQAALDEMLDFEDASADFRFASAVAAFGMLLRDSEHKGSITLDQVETMVKESLGQDLDLERQDFLKLVQKAQEIEQD